MTERRKQSSPELTLIYGGKKTPAEFARLHIEDKVSHLRQVPAKEGLDLIEEDRDREKLVQRLPPQELYWMFTEIGAEDALILFELASPEQTDFFLDVELWEKELFSQKKALEWLVHLMEAGEAKLESQLPHLDLELLILILLKEIRVAGGVGELLPNDERTEEWDHSFDNLYFIKFRNPKNARLVGTFIDTIFRLDNNLYQLLMEGVKNEVETDLEEQALLLRSGRLADLGFPSRHEAIYLYARMDPAAFRPAAEKKLMRPQGVGSPPAPLRQDTLLARALRRAGAEELLPELNYLINTAMAAEEAPFAGREPMQTVMERVSGYLSIALEYVCGEDEEKGADLLQRESFSRLFQLGHAVVRTLRKKAARVNAADYPTAKAINGINEHPPKFFRGLDPDAMDAYREFMNMEDVRKMEEFLDNLAE